MTLVATMTENNSVGNYNGVNDPDLSVRKFENANILKKIFSAFSSSTTSSTEAQTTENYSPKGLDTLTIGDQKRWLELLTARSLAEANQDEVSKIISEYQRVQESFSLQDQVTSVEVQIEANQAALALLEEWMSEPDDLGDDWWDEFENDLRQNRFTLQRD